MGFSSTSKGEFLVVPLDDGRVVITPLAWYPALAGAGRSQRGAWRLVGRGRGVSWPHLDLDLSVAGMLSGCPDVTRRARDFRPRAAGYSRVLRKLERNGWLSAG